MPLFNGKCHNLQTQKYDAKNILLFHTLNACFLLNIAWKFCRNLNIFRKDIKENMSGCFFSEHSVDSWCIRSAVRASKLWQKRIWEQKNRPGAAVEQEVLLTLVCYRSPLQARLSQWLPQHLTCHCLNTAIKLLPDLSVALTNVTFVSINNPSF